MMDRSSKQIVPKLLYCIFLKKNVVIVLSFPALLCLCLLFYNSLDPTVPHKYLRDVSLLNQMTLRRQPLLPTARTNQTFVIHIWKHGERMKRRYLRSYSKTVRDPYQYCSVRNCILTTNDSLVSKSDVVMFHLHQTKGPHTLPKYHPPHQIWIFFTDESPLHTFLATKEFSMKDYNGLFNWSMTYRRDSDVPVPYGRTVALTKEEAAAIQELPNFARRKNHFVAILGSNCGGRNNRWKYVEELQQRISVDIYGGCGTHKCPGHFTRDCTPIGNYKFYLAFENSNCKEYVTEKMWWNAYHKESVPVVMGTTKEDYTQLCPPNSFIHVDDFSSASELADYLKYLNQNDTAYNKYFAWKRHYKVLNEHGYFGSPSLHLCRICEAINKNGPVSKIYDDLGSFWNAKTDCYS